MREKWPKIVRRFEYSFFLLLCNVLSCLNVITIFFWAKKTIYNYCLLVQFCMKSGQTKSKNMYSIAVIYSPNWTCGSMSNIWNKCGENQNMGQLSFGMPFKIQKRQQQKNADIHVRIIVSVTVKISVLMNETSKIKVFRKSTTFKWKKVVLRRDQVYHAIHKLNQAAIKPFICA